MKTFTTLLSASAIVSTLVFGVVANAAEQTREQT